MNLPRNRRDVPSLRFFAVSCLNAPDRSPLARILRGNTFNYLSSPSTPLATALLLLQVAKLPIFRADRRFVGGVSNSNYVANGAPTERCRPTFAKVSHPGLLFGLCDDDGNVETSRRSRSFCTPAELAGSLPRSR